MSLPIRSEFWLFCVTLAGLLMIVTVMLGGHNEQDISVSSTTIQSLENEVQTYPSKRSIASEAAPAESRSKDILWVNNTVQYGGSYHLTEAVMVVQKGAENRLPMKPTENNMKIQVTTSLMRINTPVTAKSMTKPLFVRKNVSITAQVTTAQEMNDLSGLVVKESVDNGRTDDSNAIAMTSFNSPQSITTDGLNLYVADTNNHKIRMIEIATGRVGTLAGSGDKGADDGLGKAASFNHPRGIVTDGFNLYVTDTGNHAIRKISLVTGQVTTLAGSGEAGLVDSIGAEASFNSPRSIAISGKDLFVADYYNQSIRRVDIETGFVTTELSKKGWLGGSIDKLPYFPGSIAIDDDIMYVADYDNHTIRKINLSSGKMESLAGSGRVGSASGIGNAASFNYPCEITIVDDALYVADSGNHTIRKIDLSSGKVTKVAVSDSNGKIEDAKLGTPFGITTYDSKLFVADQGGHKIHQIDLTNQTVKTIAGSGHVGSVDSRASKSTMQEQVI